MKKIINGRKYDTDTANTIAEWDNGRGVNDFKYELETLFLKRNGEYFLFGEGGAMSKYAQNMGDNSWSGGAAIIPLSYESARQWAEKHLDADDYEEAFGEVSEDGEGDVPLSVRVPTSTRTMLDRLAAKTGRAKGDLLTEAISLLRERVETA